MIIKFPHTIPFPVTITELLVTPSDGVNRMQGILLYRFTGKFPVITGIDEVNMVEEERTEQFDSPEDGTLSRWLIRVGAVIESPSVGLCEIEEKCSHDVQFAGLCAECGEDMTM